MDAGNIINETLTGISTSFTQQIPETYKPLVVLILYTVIIAVYAIFIWKFYKFLARKNIIKMNLGGYNKTEHPIWNKFIASLLFLLEYVIVMPILVFFWFSILAIFLLILSESRSVSHILLITGAIVAATRISAYYSTSLSKDLAKMFPFTVLAIFLLNPEFFSIAKLITRFSEIPSLFNHILIYLVFIAGLEIFMRFLFLIIDFFSSEEERAVEEETEEVVQKTKK